MSTRTANHRSRSSSRQAEPKSRSVFRRGGWWENYNDAVFILFMLAIAWVPLPFGSNLPVLWAVNALLFGGLLFAFEAGVQLNGGARPVAIGRLWLTIALFAGLVGWVLLQISTWIPQSWESAFWPLARDVLQQIPDALVVEGRISADPDAGLLGLVRLASSAIAFYLALQLCRDRQRADLFVLILVPVVFGYAAYGIIQFLAFPNTLLWTEKTAYLGSLTSTFVNRNSYATYAGIGLVVTVGLLAELVQRSGLSAEVPLAYRVGTFVDSFIRRGLAIVVVILVIGIALFWTGSRAGISSSLTGVVVFVVLAATLGQRRLIMLVLGALIILSIAGMFVGYGTYFVQRLANESGTEQRWDVVRRTFEAALDVPWTGFGYGSFDRVYAVYRDSGADFVLHWDKAHNTYVELLFELGIPAFSAFVVLVTALLFRLLRNLYGREAPPMLSLTAIATSVIVLLHAFADFSLQIQAVAITYWAVLGAGLSQSWSRRIDTSV